MVAPSLYLLSATDMNVGEDILQNFKLFWFLPNNNGQASALAQIKKYKNKLIHKLVAIDLQISLHLLVF